MSIMVEYNLPEWCEGCNCLSTKNQDTGDIYFSHYLTCEHLSFCNALRTHWKLDDKQTDKINGNTSDGYHTFNELYHHRAILFAVICNANKDKAWKSKKHSDGTMYDGMFIVGINTPHGEYTYHYNIEPYWNLFDVKTLAFAPEWDGHKPEDIDRLLSLPVFGQWIPASNPPEDCEDVIVYVPGCGVEASGCHYEDGKWYVHGVKSDYVTAWMPLPEPPKKGE